MQLVNEPTDAVDLMTTPIHLGLGSRARPVAGFAWDPETLGAYGAAVADDGDEGRMVVLFEGGGVGEDWERHPGGDEVVVCLSGRMTVVHEVGGAEAPVALGPGDAVVNPRGVWHAVDVEGAARFLTITPGPGTEHRPRRTT
jgi:quercetin dioxygenase-like cupin family protein